MNQNISLQKTPLAEEHVRLGAKMVDFAGWWMPVQYQNLKDEHRIVREKVGLFDVSHMGEVRVQGPQALATLEWLTTNSVASLGAGQAQYSLLPNLEGGLVDDIIVYCLEPQNDYLVCVNASNTDKDFAWMVKNNKGATLTNESSKWAQIAVQGPQALQLISKVTGLDVSSSKPFTFLRGIFQGSALLIAMTGYTGERGGEIFVEKEGAVALWRALLEVGAPLGVAPIGLGARDTLRTEMKYSLYGHEIDDTTHPFEAGLGWVVKATAKDFIGREAMLAKKQAKPGRKLVGFKMIDRAIPRQGYDLYSTTNEKIGVVTSGTQSPSLELGIGIGYVAAPFAIENSEILVDIRGRKQKCQICPTPFVQKT